MYNFILIRSYRPEDEPFCKKLLKAGVMDALNATFLGFFTEKSAMIAVNIIVLMITAVLLVLEFPIFYCLIALLIPSFVLYIFLYITFWCKAREVVTEGPEMIRIFMSDKYSHFWVAESYEFYLLKRHQLHEQRTFMTEEEFNKSNIDVSRHIKKVVGTIGFYTSSTLENTAWITKLSVQKDYRRKKIGSHLVNQALKFGTEQGCRCISVIISEYRRGTILLFINKGFQGVRIHKELSFNSVASHELIYRTQFYRPNESNRRNPSNVRSKRNK